jgi:hypothetical protein
MVTAFKVGGPWVVVTEGYTVYLLEQRGMFPKDTVQVLMTIYTRKPLFGATVGRVHKGVLVYQHGDHLHLPRLSIYPGDFTHLGGVTVALLTILYLLGWDLTNRN